MGRKLEALDGFERNHIFELDGRYVLVTDGRGKEFAPISRSMSKRPRRTRKKGLLDHAIEVATTPLSYTVGITMMAKEKRKR